MKMLVVVEEILSRGIMVDVPDGEENPAVYAEAEVHRRYKEGEIVMTADDFCGVASVRVITEDE